MASFTNLINLTNRGGCNSLSENPVARSDNNFASSSKNSGEKSWNKEIRHWENIKKSNSIPSNSNGLTFRILSYNILAQILLDNHSYLYESCSESDLIWNTRFLRISNEIAMLKPDVICLQELQSSHVDLFNLHLQKFGYRYIYKQRTGIRQDGCAIFYKQNMFELIDHQTVEFRQPTTDVLNRDNIGIMAKLKPKNVSLSPFVICTTHLLYNPKRTDVRLAQLQVFLAEIDRFSYHNTSQHLPVILTGDFNSMPISPVIRLLTEGRINSVHFGSGLKNIAVTDSCQHLGVYLQRKKGIHLKDYEISLLYHSEKVTVVQDSDDEAEKEETSDTHKTLFNKGFIKQDLKFNSVYNFMKADGQYEASSHQDEWVTVDYIFYSSGDVSKLELLERYRLPTVDECTSVGAIPNESFGSDHFSLAAGFLLLPAMPQSSI
ncbi:protein angel [Arctopsyche grandis]|uniref:protein angel n=1 Tax=Arctopsyche grandis TaxID=121162 RepID=UPI00406D7779